MTNKLGPTGEFPGGRLNDSDGGALTIGMKADQGNVVIAFGTFVDWLGMPPDDAIEFAQRIITLAESIKKSKH